MQDQVTAILLIQQALTPVFLIVGIGTLLNVLTTRLTRIIDRVRWFDCPEAEHWQHMRIFELKSLSRRMRWANAAINFLCGATVLVCVNIFLLVLKGYVTTPIDTWIITSFVSILILLSCGLVSFFIEVSIATATLKVTNKNLTGPKKGSDSKANG